MSDGKEYREKIPETGEFFVAGGTLRPGVQSFRNSIFNKK